MAAAAVRCDTASAPPLPGAERPAEAGVDGLAGPQAQALAGALVDGFHVVDAAVHIEAGKVAADLPDQKDIDPNKIDRAVLTKQGYVVPPRMGERPDHLKNLA